MPNKIFLCTDTHFFHHKVIEYCGRPNNYEQLLYSSMKNVPEDSILLHLGDICIGRDKEAHEQYIQPLKCKKWLIQGNHDRKSYNWYYNHGWDMVCESMSIVRSGRHIVFSHKPVEILKTRGNKPVVNIHGHFHNNSHRSNEPELQRIVSPQHHLLAVEYTKYQVVPLDKFVLGN